MSYNEGPSTSAPKVPVQIFRGAALSYLGIGIAIASGTFVTPVLINHLGRGQYGIFTLSISVVTLLSFDLGLNSAVARFVANGEAHGDRASSMQALGIVLRVYLALDAVLALALIGVWLLADRLFPALSQSEVSEFRTLFALAGLVMFLNFPLYPANGTLQGLGQFVALRGSDIVWRAAVIVVTVVVVYANLPTFLLVLGWTAVALMTSVYRAVICVRDGMWRWPMPRASASMRREVRRYTSWSFFVALGQRLMITIMPAILAARSGSHAVAGFAIAAMLEGYVWLIANAVNGLFLPHVSRLIAGRRSAEIQALFERVGRFQLLVLGLVVSGFAVSGRSFLRVWLGPGYEDVYVVTILLILPNLVVQTQEVAMSVLIARGEIRYRALGTMVAAALNLPLALILTPALGSLGAAVSVSVGAWAGYGLIMNVVYARKMNLNVTAFFRSVHLRALPPIFVLTAVFFAAVGLREPKSVLGLAAVLGCFGLAYGVLAWSLILNPDDRAYAQHAIGRLSIRGRRAE